VTLAWPAGAVSPAGRIVRFERPESRLACHGNSLSRTDLVDNNRGFQMGTSHVTTPRGNGTMETGNFCPHSNCQRCYNATTVMLGINAKRYVFRTHGALSCTRPIQSVTSARAGQGCTASSFY